MPEVRVGTVGAAIGDRATGSGVGVAAGVAAGGVSGGRPLTLHYESLGRDDHPAIVLVMGLGMQMIVWPDELCRALVANGFRVIRFDNRDVGLSTQLDELGAPLMAYHYARYFLRFGIRAPYTIDHMAADAAGLIDALGLRRPHIVGASMGGMIAQNVAAQFPGKVASVVSMMSTTGKRSLPAPRWSAMFALMQPQAVKGDTEGAVRRMMSILRAIESRTYPSDEARLRDLCERHVRRAYYPKGGARQLLAIAASGDRTDIVRRIRVPVHVMHGDEDPLIHPEGGFDTAKTIIDAGGDATLSIIEGMGHDLPEPLLSRIVDEIVGHCRRSV